MRISTGVALILSSGLFVGTANQAFAGSKSVLDPYDGVQASPIVEKKPKVKKQHENKKVAKVKMAQEDRSVDSDNKAVTEKPKSVRKDDSSGFLSRGTHAVGHGLKTTGETINDGSRAASAKLVSASKTVGHGVKATGETLAEGSKVAGQKMKVVPGKIGAGLKAGGSEVKEGTVAVGSKMKKGTEAVGSGMKASAVKVKDGTKTLGKKMAALPGAIGSRLGLGKLFGHGDAPKATAQTTGGGIQ